jgi:hypothetical protein|tara:strand:- start:7 stop:228 length:222 start_codon:yes stop_codon:yes gene_type:complete
MANSPTINKYPFMGYEAELKKMISMVKVNLTAIDTVSEFNGEQNVCDMICAINGPINQLSTYIDTLVEEKELD